MADYQVLVNEKQQEQAILDARMQADANLLYLKRYVLVDSKGAKVPDIINITLNRPAVFAANVISALGNASQQIVVESEDRAVDTAQVELFLNAAFDAADNILAQKPGRSLLNPFADTQLCIRGRTARRVLFGMENGEIVPLITPWDGRYTYYEVGKEGLAWAAYKTRRSKEAISREYGVRVSGKEGEILDVWDTKHNEVWIEGIKHLEQEHQYGYTPVVVSLVSLGYGDILLDANRIEHEGESIFFLIRDIVSELNRLASILQTLNMKAVKPPMVQKRKGGGEPSEYEDATGMGAITGMDVGEGIEAINYGDARRAAEVLYGIMEKSLQSGGLSDIDLGNLQFPLSAVALVTLGEGRDQVYLPRLQAKGQLNKLTSEMVIKQVLQIGGTVELGVRGRQNKFSTRKLEGDYSVSFKYTNKSPKTDIARMSIAAAAEKYLDPETILKDVLQIDDWQGTMAKRYYYMAEQIDPHILQHRIIMSMLELAEKGDENAAREAKIMAATMGMSLAQVKAGVLPKPVSPEQKPGEPLVPLLGEGGKTGGLPTSAMKGMPQQEVPQEVRRGS